MEKTFTLHWQTNKRTHPLTSSFQHSRETDNFYVGISRDSFWWNIAVLLMVVRIACENMPEELQTGSDINER